MRALSLDGGECLRVTQPFGFAYRGDGGVPPLQRHRLVREPERLERQLMPRSGRRGEKLDPGPDATRTLARGEDSRLSGLPQRRRQLGDPGLLLIEPDRVPGRQGPESGSELLDGGGGQVVHRQLDAGQMRPRLRRWRDRRGHLVGRQLGSLQPVRVPLTHADVSVHRDVAPHGMPEFVPVQQPQLPVFRVAVERRQVIQLIPNGRWCVFRSSRDWENARHRGDRAA